MPLTMPDLESTPTFDGQAAVDSTDWAALEAGFTETSVLSGMLVSPHTGSDMLVSIASGTYQINGTAHSYAGGTATIANASASDRRDIVTINASGTITVTPGTVCGTAGWTRTSAGLPPAKPTIPSGNCLLGEVYVAASTTAITTGNIIDKTLSGLPAAVASLAAGDSSIVIGGTATAPTVETGTLDVIASDHPPAAGWSNNSKKITSLANGSGAQDAAAFGQIPTDVDQLTLATRAVSSSVPTSNQGLVYNGTMWVPSLVAQLASGSQQAFTGEVKVPDLIVTGLTGATTSSRYVGSTLGGAPTSGTFGTSDWCWDISGNVWVCVIAGTPGHWVNITDPTVFHPATYGAVGDVKFGSAGSITHATTTFTDPNGVFTTADVGKVFALSALTKTGADLITTIAGFTSATSVTLAAGPPSVDYSGTAFYAYGTDDTVAIQACINAAATAFQNPNGNAVLGGKGKAVIQFEEAGYMLNGALVQTSGYNAQLTLPIITWTDNTNSPFFLEFRGRGENMPSGGATETQAPTIGGTMWFSTQSNPSAYSNTTGVNSVIGCRSIKGTVPAFSMMIPAIRGINFVFPFNVGATAMDFGTCTGAIVERTSLFTNCPQSTVNLQTAPWAVSCGLIMPQVNCGGMSVVNDFYVWNCQYGIIPGEHTNGRNWAMSGCISAIGILASSINGSYAWNEGATVIQFDTFLCKYVITGADFTSTSTPPSVTNRANLSILSSSIEESTTGGMATVHSILDSTNKLFGEMHFFHITTGIGPSNGLTSVVGAANLVLFDCGAAAYASPLGMGANKITGLANGTVSTDAAAFGQIPVVDSNTAHLQPLGTATAGSNGKWADSGHIHPNSAPGALLAIKQYAPAVAASISIPNNTIAALDTTNLTISFVVPASGQVIVRLNGTLQSGATGNVIWCLVTHSTTTVVGFLEVVQIGFAGGGGSNTIDQLLTGLTPGATVQLDWAAALSTGSAAAHLIAQGISVNTPPTGSPAVMEVIAA